MKASLKQKIKKHINFEAPMLPANTTVINGIDHVIDADFSLYNLFKGKPQNFFLVRVNGESMLDIGINNGDLLIVETNNSPQKGQVVIASLNGEMLVKKFEIINEKVYLISANKRFLPIEIFPDEQFQIHGIVRHVIHSMS